MAKFDRKGEGSAINRQHICIAENIQSELLFFLNCSDRYVSVVDS